LNRIKIVTIDVQINKFTKGSPYNNKIFRRRGERGLTYSEENGNISRENFSILFEQENVTLGYLTTQAKFAAYNKGISTGVIRSFILFGDPATRLKDWR